MKNNMRYVGMVFVVLFLSVVVVNAQTWTAPTSAPPNGNTNPPLHEGGTAQSKAGGLLIATGSVTNGLIVQNGNVGIGTTNPLYKMHILENGLTGETSSIFSSGTNPGRTLMVQGGGAAYLVGRDVTNDIEFSMGSSASGVVFAGSMTAHDLQLRTSNTVKLTVKDNTGYIGIGTASPEQKLDVNGYVKGTGLCIGSDCKTAWPSGGSSSISQCGVNFQDFNGSGWSTYKYQLCQGYLPYSSAGTDTTLGVPRGCPSGYSALKQTDDQGAVMYTCIDASGWTTYPGYSGTPRLLFGPF